MRLLKAAKNGLWSRQAFSLFHALTGPTMDIKAYQLSDASYWYAASAAHTRGEKFALWKLSSCYIGETRSIQPRHDASKPTGKGANAAVHMQATL